MSYCVQSLDYVLRCLVVMEAVKIMVWFPQSHK